MVIGGQGTKKANIHDLNNVFDKITTNPLEALKLISKSDHYEA